jgi:hypothetical protein
LGVPRVNEQNKQARVLIRFSAKKAPAEFPEIIDTLNNCRACNDRYEEKQQLDVFVVKKLGKAESWTVLLIQCERKNPVDKLKID